MNSFSEARFENGVVTLNMQGGAEFSTTVVTVNSGFEQRNQNWTQARGKWQLGNRTVTPEEYQTLTAFFRARRGRFQGFRLKDWLDYKDDGQGVLGAANQTGEPVAGDAVAGVSVYQLFKRYPSGDDVYFRKIDKPVNDGTLKIYADGVALSMGTGPGQYVPDFTTGQISIGATTKTVTAATNAAAARLTIAGHGLFVGDKVQAASFTAGWAAANGQTAVVLAVVSPSVVEVSIDSRTFGAFDLGVVRWWIQERFELTWTGEFDVAVRFDVDSFDAKLEAVIHGPEGISHNSQSYVTIGNVPVIALRL